MTAVLPRQTGAHRTVPADDPGPLCVLPGHEHRAHDGLLVCNRHLQELGRLLRTIEDEAIHLSAVPTYGGGYDRSGGATPAAERAPARLEVIAFRDPRTRTWEPDPEPRYRPPQPKSYGPWCLFCDHETCTAWRAGRRRDLHDDEQDAGSAGLASVLYELHNWARLVREERHLTAPERVTVVSERSCLTTHLDWIARQPWVDEMHRDLATLARQLQRANGSQEIPVGTCDTLQPGGDLCDGDVWHVLIRPDGSVARGARTTPDPDDEPGFRCGKCRRVWTGTEAVRKRDQMWRDEQARKSERSVS